jgi:hypothetical protein
MKSPEDITSLSREELLAENAQLQRSVKRQATPFSKGTKVRQPKGPGGKPGSGTFSFRQAPRREEITEPPVEVPVTLEACPGCDGQLEKERIDFAYITSYLPCLVLELPSTECGSAAA